MRALWLVLLLLLLPGTAPAEAALPTDCPAVPGQPIVVKVGLHVLDFNYIRSNEQTYSMIGYLTLRWKDPRLAHAGPARRIPRDQLWFPLLDVANAQELVKMTESAVEVQPDGSCQTWTRFKAVLNSPFELQRFPFDSTDLIFEVQAMQESYDQLKLVTDGDFSHFAAGEFEGEWEINEKWFEGNDLATKAYDTEPVRYAVGRFTMQARRYWQYYIWIYFVPLVLVVATCWTVLWTNPPNIQVTTTALLGAIMHRIAVGSALPRIHLLTYADGFFLLSLFWILTSNVVVSLILRLDERKSPRRDQLRRAASLLLPLGYLVAQVILYSLFFPH